MLEVGVGTGINLSLYPREADVTGIDFSASMLEKARERAARPDAAPRPAAADGRRRRCSFADDSFDIVYAPYLISVVPDPVKVAQEMRRVCRPGGRIIFLNHFLSPNPLLSRIERLISPATIHIGFKSDLDLPAFLAQADLKPVSIEKVNWPRIWSLVTCVKESAASSQSERQLAIAKPDDRRQAEGSPATDCGVISSAPFSVMCSVVLEPDAELAADVDPRFVAEGHVRLQRQRLLPPEHVVAHQVRPLVAVHAHAVADAVGEVLEARAVAGVDDHLARGGVDRLDGTPGRAALSVAVCACLHDVEHLLHLVGRLAEHERAA